jgi:metal-responsive CopG/Arc/MetJ family transcriptional regulator
MKVNITLDDNLMQKIDAFADENHMSRSGFVSHVCTDYIKQAELLSTIKSLGLAMNRIAENGLIDDDAKRQLQDFQVIANYFVPE